MCGTDEIRNENNLYGNLNIMNVRKDKEPSGEVTLKPLPEPVGVQTSKRKLTKLVEAFDDDVEADEEDDDDSSDDEDVILLCIFLADFLSPLLQHNFEAKETEIKKIKKTEATRSYSVCPIVYVPYTL